MEQNENDRVKNTFSQFRSLTKIQKRILPRLLSRKEKILLTFFIVMTIASASYAATTLVNQYSVDAPAHGGTLREGIVGIPRFINPLLAITDADRDLASLVYTGLMRFDGTGTFMPSLASHYERSDDGRQYTFYLREDARWNDGAPLTADDVVFTISLAQNPAYRSVVRANWEGVTVEKQDTHTVVFRLAKPYAPFLENTTLGILPKHIWQNVHPAEFHLAEQNLMPIGIGPYRAVSYEQNANGRITVYNLEANNHYLPEKPYIQRIEFRFYATEENALRARNNGVVDSVSTPAIDSALSDSSEFSFDLPVPRVFGVFFNQNTPILADDAVRKALTRATDRRTLIQEVLSGDGSPLTGPLPPPHTAATSSEFNPVRAAEILANAGWEMQEDGIRIKTTGDEEERLSFSVSTSDAPDLVKTARLLQEMWHDVGIEIQVAIFEIGDFEQNVLRPRRYDAVLFGEVYGYEPDPFAFWHSSQRNDPGLNIALYTNPRADTLLENARVEHDTTARRALYHQFETIVQEEEPALFLYSPHYHYIPSPAVRNITINRITVPADRFGSVHEWYIQTKKEWREE